MSREAKPRSRTLWPRDRHEMQQMQVLADWHACEKPFFGLASLVAVWREIIGAALAQQAVFMHMRTNSTLAAIISAWRRSM